jgi:hypothetical protein
MVRYLSAGTVTIVALMAAHRRAQGQSSGSGTLDDFFKQEAARVDRRPPTSEGFHLSSYLAGRTAMTGVKVNRSHFR